MKTIASLILATAAVAMAQDTPPPVTPPANPAPATPEAPLNTWEQSSFSLIPRAFQKYPHINVMLMTEFTRVGHAAAPATAENPVYYTGRDGGQVTVGDVIAGESPPPASELSRILVASLNASHFKPADAAHPPDIFIFYRWGSYNRLSPIDGSQVSAPDDMEIENLAERAAIVGGSRFALNMIRALGTGTLQFFENQTQRNQFLVQEAYSDLYFLIASAYDYHAATQGKIVLLWRTKISTDSRGITMDESLPQMVASAAKYVGHPTDGPVRLNRVVVPEGHVEIGTPTVREDLPPDTPSNPTPAPEAPKP